MCDNCNEHLEGNHIITIIEPALPFCEDCGNNHSCTEKLDTACVVYHLDNPNQPSLLQNLGMPNGATAEEIFEAIDDLVGTGFNTPLIATDTSTIDLTATGTANHSLKADVKVSASAGNALSVKSDGLYSTGGASDGKVKVNSGDTLDYLADQVIGGTDSIVSIDIDVASGLLALSPSIDLAKLVIELSKRPDFAALICSLIKTCQETCPTITDINATTEA